MKTPLYDGARATGVERRRFTGNADHIASDIGTYRDLGVSHIIFDFRSGTVTEILERMEGFATDVVPRV